MCCTSSTLLVYNGILGPIKACVQPELGTRYLKSSANAAIWQKSIAAAAYRYLNKKVAALWLLACKTAAAAACCYFKKINSKENDGIQMRYLMVKFLLYLRKLFIPALKILVQVTIDISRLK